MRVHLSDDHNAESFSQTLLNSGNRTFQNNDDRTVQIDSTFAILVHEENDIINKVYLKISLISNEFNEWLCDRAILAPKNDTV